MPRRKVAVVGAGIIGVATAVNIQALCPDADVAILAEKFSPDTTSDGAAGFIQPYLVVGTPNEDVMRWFSSTFKHLWKIVLSTNAGKSGVHFTSGYNIYKHKVPEPNWKDDVIDFRIVPEKELQLLFPSFKFGWFYTTFMCEGHRYIPFLTERFQKNGGILMQRRISSFAELSGQYDVVVNCTGVWSRFLANDDSVRPVRGQVMRLSKQSTNDFVGHSSKSEGAFYYIPSFPMNLANTNLSSKSILREQQIFTLSCVRIVSPTTDDWQDDVTLGGTAQVDRWDTEVDQKDSKEIWERAVGILPSLKDAKILKEWVGLRPQRTKGIRVEAETMNFGTEKVKVVHNYGHGGAGITLHWGCAEDAAKLVQKELSYTPPKAKL
ncbi:D-aspartate oxidase-like [Diadema setosum]|uniref:D-aspartate oxidase-like n=1 Tax=Diadema setosum TaxID=31175 RepID=UPI003B3A970A